MLLWNHRKRQHLFISLMTLTAVKRCLCGRQSQLELCQRIGGLATLGVNMPQIEVRARMGRAQFKGAEVIIQRLLQLRHGGILLLQPF